MSTAQEPVLIAGGGWAGLAAAVELSQHGIPVRLIEAARQLGGRARRVRLGDLSVDNGQHLLIGAYRETLALLQQLGVDENALLRSPLRLEIYEGSQCRLHLHAPRLPAPLHLLAALLSARGLDRRDRLRALAMGLYLRRHQGKVASDSTVSEFLRQQRQTTTTIRLLWEPLCLATLNTPMDIASAAVFARVLYDALFRTRSDSDLLFARHDLGALLPDPATGFIENHGGSIELGKRLTHLYVDAGRLRAVNIDGEPVAASRLILAVSPEQCRDLCREHAALADIHAGLAQLDYQPICTVYLEYPPDIRLAQPAIGMVGGLCQWLFDRRHTGNPGVMAAVISATGPHMAMDNTALIRAVQEEITRVYPHCPAPRRARVIREKRATFACRPGSDTLRPASATPVEGLWLAGDFTATGYPATLEGAVRSGRRAAQQILDGTAQGTST